MTTGSRPAFVEFDVGLPLKAGGIRCVQLRLGFQAEHRPRSSFRQVGEYVMNERHIEHVDSGGVRLARRKPFIRSGNVQPDAWRSAPTFTLDHVAIRSFDLGMPAADTRRRPSHVLHLHEAEPTGEDVDLYDLSGLAAIAAEVREAAARNFLHSEDDWWGPARVPYWIMQWANPREFKLSLVAGSSDPDPVRAFDITRRTEAVAFCRTLNGGVEPEVAGGFLSHDAVYARPVDDLRALAAVSAPLALRDRHVDPVDLPAEMLKHWHAVSNGKAIVDAFGADGATRVLRSFVLFSDYAAEVYPARVVHGWGMGLLRARIAAEGFQASAEEFGAPVP